MSARSELLEAVAKAAREYYSCNEILRKSDREELTEDDFYHAAMAAGALHKALQDLDTATKEGGK